jgi:hypothetical protein
MINSSFLYAAAAIALLMLFFWFVAPRLRLVSYRSDIIRAILFFGMMSYLAYDFYIKEKYTLLVVLAMGSAAFLYYLLSSRGSNK